MKLSDIKINAIYYGQQTIDCYPLPSDIIERKARVYKVDKFEVYYYLYSEHGVFIEKGRQLIYDFISWVIYEIKDGERVYKKGGANA